MTVIVEPVLTEEKLRLLLDEQHEQSCLDYKRMLDLSETRHVVELAKDVAAMQSEESGGYIVVAADDRGTVVPDLTPTAARLFDEASLRSKLKKYLAEPFEVRAAIHSIDGNNVVLIYVGASQQGWCIFACDGEYTEEAYKEGAKTKRKVTVFRVGDVFVRHGTASERWQDSDQRRLVQRIVARRKEAWRVEFRNELAALGESSLTARRLEELPSSALTWRLDAAGFDQLVTELIRRNDDIPLLQLLTRLPGEAGTLIDGEPDELGDLLDRLTSIGALAIQFDRHQWLERVLTAFVAIYDLGFDPSSGYERNRPTIVQLWIDIVAHAYALGALAVRLEDWDSVRLLADRRPHGESFSHYGSWIRHSFTQAARANMIGNLGLIERGHNVVRGLQAAHPDRASEDEAILNSLCQFDALGCLVVIGERGSTDSGNYYPSFARYRQLRSAPAFAGMVHNTTMRHELFVGSDQQLADAMAEILSRADKENFRYGNWAGIDDGAVSTFIALHGSPGVS
jgi:hypothetical protein